MTGHWECTACSNSLVLNRILIANCGGLEVHRVTCEICRAVGHYDLDVRTGEHPTRTLNRIFHWVPGDVRKATVRIKGIAATPGNRHSEGGAHVFRS